MPKRSRSQKADANKSGHIHHVLTESQTSVGFVHNEEYISCTFDPSKMTVELHIAPWKRTDDTIQSH